MNRAMSIAVTLLLLLAVSLSATEPRLRPLDFSQQVSPNSEGQVEGNTELFFNWGAFRTGIQYKSETIVQNYLDADQDTFVNQQSRTYNLVLLKTKNGLIGSKTFSINPFIGIKMVDRTEKRIGEALSAGYWFTEESEDRFFNFYGSADIVIDTRAFKLMITAGGGYILKETSGDFRNSEVVPVDLSYTSSDYGFNFFSDVNLLLKMSAKFTVGLSFSYNREASYYERYYIGAGQENYAYYTHEFSYGFHIYLDFLKKALNGTPFIGITYIDYRREIQTGSREKFDNQRFKFDVGVKL